MIIKSPGNIVGEIALLTSIFVFFFRVLKKGRVLFIYLCTSINKEIKYLFMFSSHNDCTFFVLRP